MRQPVFIWRSSEPPKDYIGRLCQYCKGTLQFTTYMSPEEIEEPGWREFFEENYDNDWDYTKGDQEYHAIIANCLRCGWWVNALRHIHGAYVNRYRAANLLEFEIGSSDLGLNELISHLSRHFTDVYSLHPRKLEEIVAEVYRNLNYDVTLTSQSRDGGCDLICLNNNDGSSCIVEVKRYAKKRKIGIEIIDRLIGVQIRTGVNEAHIVTSSSFTKPGVNAANEATRKGIQLKLVDGHKLLNHLHSISDPSLTPNDLKSIFSDMD